MDEQFGKCLPEEVVISNQQSVACNPTNCYCDSSSALRPSLFSSRASGERHSPDQSGYPVVPIESTPAKRVPRVHRRPGRRQRLAVAGMADAAGGGGGGGGSDKRTPSEFLKNVLGRPVVVKLNSGVDYRGKPPPTFIAQRFPLVQGTRLPCIGRRFVARLGFPMAAARSGDVSTVPPRRYISAPGWLHEYRDGAD